jgi:hypothetical protein
VRGICEKPRIKCADCQHRRFLAVTDDVIRWHLSGHDDAGQPFVAGVYPLLQDEMCWFLAVLKQSAKSLSPTEVRDHLIAIGYDLGQHTKSPGSSIR